MNPSSHAVTPLYARLLLRLVRPFPNFDVSFVKPVRAEAVRLLRLRPGNRVLDVGCGMGGSFPFLVDAVGPDGEVVGVEISPETLVNARRRIHRNRWSNVGIAASPAQSVALRGQFDGLIMFAAPDVYASAEALANLLPYLRDGARIVCFGAKRTRGIAGAALNPLFAMAVSTLSFETTPRPDDEPWRLLAQHVERIEVRTLFFGSMFLASGSVAARAGVVVPKHDAEPATAP